LARSPFEQDNAKTKQWQAMIIVRFYYIIKPEIPQYDQKNLLACKTAVVFVERGAGRK